MNQFFYRLDLFLLYFQFNITLKIENFLVQNKLQHVYCKIAEDLSKFGERCDQLLRGLAHLSRQMLDKYGSFERVSL